MSKTTNVVNAPLPQDILPIDIPSNNDAEKYIHKMVLESVRPCDRKDINASMKWAFILQKHSLKKRKNNVKRKTFLTREQRKELGLLKLPKTDWNYNSLESLRNVWRGYMRQNLDLASKAPDPSHPDWNAFSILLTKSELIGAEVKIIKSKVPSQVGMSGTIVLETKMTIQIVTNKNELKCIIKSSAVFEFMLDSIRFVVYGKRIMTRPNERSIKKIRTNMAPIL